MTYQAKIWHLEVILDADFEYDTENLKWCCYRPTSMTSLFNKQ